MTYLHVVSIACALSAILFAGAAAAGEPPARGRPTIVLVHGALTDASVWDDVTCDLQKRGFAERARSRTREVDSSHAVPVAHPAEVVKTILDAVQAVTR